MIISGETMSTVIRRNRRGASVAAGCAAALLLSACGGSSSGSKNAAGTNPSGSSSSSTTISSATSSSTADSGSASASGPLTPATLAAKMLVGSASIKSAHITLSSTVGAKSLLSGQGDETLSGGKVTALDLTEQVSGMSIGMRIVGTAIFAKLPASAGGSTAKPWTRLDPNSSNATLKQLAQSLTSAASSSSVSNYGKFAQVATSAKDLGPGSVAGTSAEHYRLVIDPAKLAQVDASVGALAEAGISTIPVDLWLDSENRPVQFLMNLSVQGQSVSTKVAMSNFDKPVTITAPPADQIAN